MKRLKLNIKTITNVVNSFCALFLSLGLIKTQDGRAARKCVQLFSRWLTCEGRQGLDRWKDLSLFFTRRIMGLGVERPEHRIPRCFWALNNGSKDVNGSIFVLTVLQSHRLVKLEPVMDVSEMVRPSRASWLSLVWEFGSSLWNSGRVFKRFVKPFKEVELRWFLTENSGPNGKVGWRRYLEDWYAIKKDPFLEWNLKFLYQELPISNREEVETFWASMEDWTKYYMFDPSVTEGKLHSRLSFLSDKGGKTRVVALGDIFSQSLLKPVHDHLFRLLKVIPVDGTFDQDRQRRRVQEQTRSVKPLYSLDLSAATDRFPAIVIAWALWKMDVLTFWQSVAWLLVISSRGFGTPLGEVRYAVGQPMGMLSSWAAFSVTHHYIVQTAAYHEGHKGFFQDYALLGDDIVIFDEKVAKTYVKIIDLLGVDISMHKSVTGIGVAEFAKSLFRNGDNLKPIGLAQFKYSWDEVVSSALSLVSDLREHCIRVDLDHILNIYPVKERLKLTNALISPLNPVRSWVGGIPPSSFDGQILATWLFVREINALDNRKMYQAWVDLKDEDPIVLPHGVVTPYVQYTREGLSPYTERLLTTENLSSKVLIGQSFIAYDPITWMTNPELGKQPRRASWALKKDNRKVVSSLAKFSKLLPFYLWPTCGNTDWSRIKG